MPSKVWDEIAYSFLNDKIAYSFLNFNDATIDVWEWINNPISHFMMYVVIYPY